MAIKFVEGPPPPEVAIEEGTLYVTLEGFEDNEPGLRVHGPMGRYSVVGLRSDGYASRYAGLPEGFGLRVTQDGGEVLEK